MKMSLRIFLFFIYLLQTILSLRLKSKKSRIFNFKPIDFLKFDVGSTIDNLTLKKKLFGSHLIETWIVHRLDGGLKKPLIAHFFKYTTTEKSVANEKLNDFCLNIIKLNNQVDNQVENIQFLKCKDDTVQNGVLLGNNYFYWLFENPVDSFLFSEICRPDCAKERVCKYKIKDFIRGFIKTNQNPSDGIMDVKINLTPHTIYYGKLDKNDKDNRRSFIALPYPMIKSISDFDQKQLEEVERQSKFEELQVEFGRFLINMYTGFDNATAEKPSEEFSDLNPFLIEFADTLQVFEKLNPKNKILIADEYFGISSEFINSYKAKETSKGKELLENSFYDFIFKLLNKQYKKIEEIAQHKYVTSDVPLNKIRSDTLPLEEEKK